MKMKKLLACIMAAALVTGSPVTVFASAVTPSAIEGAGNIDYVDTSEVLEVTLPTTDSLDFVVDPQGLLSLEDGESKEVSELTGKGAIIAAENSGAYIKNESNVDVAVTVKMHVEDTGSAALKSAVDDVEGGEDLNMLLLAVPGKGSYDSIADYEASSAGIPIASKLEASPTEFTFLLNASIYKITNNDSSYEYNIATDIENNFDAASFKISGQVNSEADWSEYTTGGKAIEVKAVFSCMAADEEELGATDAYGLTDTAATIEWITAPADAAPSIKTASVVTNTINGVDIMINLGAGDLAATGISSITFINASSVKTELGTNRYDFNAATGKLHITGEYCGLLTADRTFTVTFNDTAKTTATFMIKMS